jgi:hypothetical protein
MSRTSWFVFVGALVLVYVGLFAFSYARARPGYGLMAPRPTVLRSSGQIYPGVPSTRAGSPSGTSRRGGGLSGGK